MTFVSQLHLSRHFIDLTCKMMQHLLLYFYSALLVLYTIPKEHKVILKICSEYTVKIRKDATGTQLSCGQHVESMKEWVIN